MFGNSVGHDCLFAVAWFLAFVVLVFAAESLITWLFPLPPIMEVGMLDPDDGTDLGDTAMADPAPAEMVELHRLEDDGGPAVDMGGGG